MTGGLPNLARAVHLCVDMQRLFAEETDWHTPALTGIVPNIARIVRARPGNTIFARFLVPARAEDVPGAWQDYYRRWPGIVAAAAADPALIDLVPALAALTPGETVLDKLTYSMFTGTGLAGTLAARGGDTVIVTGVETDVCVLATVMSAVELGLRVIIPTDAVASSSHASHEATLRLVLPRIADQVALPDTATLIRIQAAAP